MPNLDIMTALMTRRSIRKFAHIPMKESDIQLILKAAMLAPASENAHNHAFVIITDKQKLEELPTLHPSAAPAANAPLAFLLCCNTAKDTTAFWPQDCAAATQNILIAARALGLGSLWCGIHPIVERETAFQKAFGLPSMVRPFSLVLVGYPLQNFYEDETRYTPASLHANRWEYPYITEKHSSS